MPQLLSEWSRSEQKWRRSRQFLRVVSKETPEKIETLELNPQNSRKNSKTQGKNSKLKGKTQFFGIFMCWRCGKDGQTISLV